MPGLVGLAVMMVISGMGVMRSASPDTMADRLSTYGTREGVPSLEELELEDSFFDRVIRPAVQRFAKLIIRFAPHKTLKETELKLAKAGNPNGWRAADFFGLRGLGALIAAGVPLIAMVAAGSPLTQVGGGVLLFGALGFAMPGIWLDRIIKARQHEIQKALPDALDLMTVSVEAGLAFDSALQKVSEKWDNELARAFERVTKEMRIGRTRREAMREMSDRIDVDDVTAFVAAVLQADQLGVSMAKVLRIQSEQMRIRRRQRAEESAAKAPIKMLFPMVFLIFPSLFIVLLGPAVLILMDTFAGGGPGS
ncbi:MAG: type II secretion system F family protein [Ardenticatenales bacterium]|nr:type II secretion system F family protein [Ardenticatenales bacterium]